MCAIICHGDGSFNQYTDANTNFGGNSRDIEPIMEIEMSKREERYLM